LYTAKQNDFCHNSQSADLDNLEAVHRYRNKNTFSYSPQVGGRAVLGLKRARSAGVVPISECLLQSAEANQVLATLSELLEENKVDAYVEAYDKGFLKRVVIREGASSSLHRQIGQMITPNRLGKKKK
jgi:tRNA/tmRNA/rRNA uracil-C5-methylase (TrmA/RlmC/RlmD family)